MMIAMIMRMRTTAIKKTTVMIKIKTKIRINLDSVQHTPHHAYMNGDKSCAMCFATQHWSRRLLGCTGHPFPFPFPTSPNPPIIRQYG